jgi:endonuclease/exonuclease/phosphatase family metal-dependent hydrolase
MYNHCINIRNTLLLAFVLMLGSTLHAQEHFRVMWWNVENLFDARHDTLRNDQEFLPEGERAWTWGRFWRKLEDVGRVVMAIGNGRPPALVGLAEVENDSVMIALTRRGSLRALGYQYVMTDSPDQRGVDVALMYQPELFSLIGSESRRIASLEHGFRPTRDLLHAWGRIPSGDTLHVVLCHLPSRAGNAHAAQRHRRLAATTLAQLCDSLLSMSPRCRLLVMGDFNAPPRDAVFRKVLNRLPLTSLVPQRRRPTSGTYRFQGNWSWIDHILVSAPLFPSCQGGARLYTAPWMQRTLADGSWYPRRTYMGPHYGGGVSDHVPIYCDFYGL